MPVLPVGCRGAQGAGCDGDLGVSGRPEPAGRGELEGRGTETLQLGWLIRKEKKNQETDWHFVKLMNLRRKTRSCPAGKCAGPRPCVRQPTPQPERDRGFEFEDVLSRSREAASSEPRGSEAETRLSFSVSRRGCPRPGARGGWGAATALWHWERVGRRPAPRGMQTTSR